MTHRLIVILTCILAFSVFAANPTYGLASGWSDNFSKTSASTNIGDDSLTVTVYVTFIVDKQGRVKNVEVLKTACDSCGLEIKNRCEQEALRVVRNMPQWEPPKTQKIQKEQRYNLPIKFVLPKEE